MAQQAPPAVAKAVLKNGGGGGGGSFFGRLWGRGHERLTHRRILSVSGPGATPYLQNLVTSNLLQPPVCPKPEPADTIQPGVPKHLQKQQQQSQQSNTNIRFNTEQLRATCFLDPKGRVLTDSLLWKIVDDDNEEEEKYYIDVPDAASSALLLQHLHQYKVGRSTRHIQIRDESGAEAAVVFGTLASDPAPVPGYLSGLDPRHPSLGLRILKLPQTDTTSDEKEETQTPDLMDLLKDAFPETPDNYQLVRRLAGVAEGTELHGRVALETNQEHLNAVSFDKGCYLGQELTARVHHTGVLRKRVLPLLLQDPHTEVPQAWGLASRLQQGRLQKRFTAHELRALPSRLPRLSVLTAGNLVAVTTASILQPETTDAADKAAAEEWQRMQHKTSVFLEQLQKACRVGEKLVDVKTGTTVGQIVAPPVPGTNVVLALMRLESVGLLKGGVWLSTNRVKIGNGGDNEFRYLPYLPLWWPELDMQTGKAIVKSSSNDNEDSDNSKEQQLHDYADEARDPNDTTTTTANTPSSGGIPPMARFEIEEIPLTEAEKAQAAAEEEEEAKAQSTTSTASNTTTTTSTTTSK